MKIVDGKLTLKCCLMSFNDETIEGNILPLLPKIN